MTDTTWTISLDGGEPITLLDLDCRRRERYSAQTSIVFTTASDLSLDHHHALDIELRCGGEHYLQGRGWLQSATKKSYGIKVEMDVQPRDLVV